jgi:hypothetical protein
MEGGVQAVVTQSQLPPELREAVKARSRQAIETLRKTLAPPTTQP